MDVIGHQQSNNGEKVKNQTLNITDGLNLKDSIAKKNDEETFKKLENYLKNTNTVGPLGWVKVFLQKNKDAKKQLVFEDHNMVVAQGRNFVAQRIFNYADATDFRNYRISHFSVGAGGASVNNDTVTLLGPNVCDTHIYKPITLNSTHNEPGNYDNSALSNSLKDIYTSVGAVKPIDSLELISESYGEGTSITCAYNTKVKCECIVASGEPNALASDGYVPINEAGLYLVNGTDAKMFAHVCFPPKYKELDSILTIEWYILC